MPTGREWPAELHVYTPPTPATGPLPTVVMFDAQAWMGLDITATFDNLIADGLVQPFLSILIGYPFAAHDASRASPIRASTLSYLLDELMPWAVADLGATADPARTTLVGQSLGGLAAVASALRARTASATCSANPARSGGPVTTGTACPART